MNSMMALLLFCGALAFGSYTLLAAAWHLPSARAVRVLAALNDDTRVSMSEALTRPIAIPLSRHLRLGGYRRKSLQHKLSMAGSEQTPERYVADALTLGLYIFLAAALLMILSVRLGKMPLLLGVFLAVMGALTVRKMLRRVNRWTDQYHVSLIAELPRLATTLRQSLNLNAVGVDIYYVLNQYRAIAGSAMRRELTILLADMATGDREIALNRWAERLNSADANSLARALLGIDKGEDMRSFLAGLDVQLHNAARNRLHEEAENRPEELRPANILLLFSMLALFAVSFGTIIWNDLQVVSLM